MNRRIKYYDKDKKEEKEVVFNDVQAGPSNIIHDPSDIDLLINEENINRELMDQPLKMRKWTEMKAKTERKVGAIKAKLEQVESEVYLKASGSVKERESFVNLDKEVVKLKEELLDAEESASKLDGIVRSLIQRHDSLKEISYNKRKELID